MLKLRETITREEQEQEKDISIYMCVYIYYVYYSPYHCSIGINFPLPSRPVNAPERVYEHVIPQNIHIPLATAVLLQN